MFRTTVKSIPFDNENRNIWKYNRLLEGYNIWLKYQHLVLMENYIFRSYPHKDDSSFHTIIFLKTERVLKVIQDNLSLFKAKLGPLITLEKILNDLETKYNILDEVFQGNYDLVGILLGYGVHHSEKFQKIYFIQTKITSSSI